MFEINCRLVWWCALCEVYSGVVVCLKSTVDWCGGVLGTKGIAGINTCVLKVCQAAVYLNDVLYQPLTNNNVPHNAHSARITLQLITGTFSVNSNVADET